MDEISDDTKAGFQRVELLTGAIRRRRWSADEKARIVAETLLPGARVSEVARRWQLHPQQLFGWRRDTRVEKGARQAAASGMQPSFAPIVVTADVGVPAAPMEAVRSSITRADGQGWQSTAYCRAAALPTVGIVQAFCR